MGYVRLSSTGDHINTNISSSTSSRNIFDLKTQVYDYITNLPEILGCVNHGPIKILKFI